MLEVASKLRVVDFLLYSLIGIGFVGLAVVAARSDMSPHEAGVWFGSAFCAVSVVGYCIHQERKNLRSRLLWIAIAILLVFQGAITHYVLGAKEWKSVWWTPIGFAEITAFEGMRTYMAGRRLNAQLKQPPPGSL